MKLTILGAGAWGTALASHAASTHDVVLWGRDAAQISAMAASGVNAGYLPGLALSPRLAYESDFARAGACGHRSQWTGGRRDPGVGPA